MPKLLCGECGFHASTDLLRDRREHLVHHEEHFYGVRLRRLDCFEQVTIVRGLAVLAIRPDSIRFAKRRAERVSRRAIREPLFEGRYDRPTFFADNGYRIVPEMQSHAIVLASGDRGVGLVVIERRERKSWHRWSEADDAYVLGSTDGEGNSWSIAHVWLLPAFRRLGLARTLLDIVFDGLSTDGAQVGWVGEFTGAGFDLVRHFAPSGFWLAGDKPKTLERLPKPFPTQYPTTPTA